MLMVIGEAEAHKPNYEPKTTMNFVLDLLIQYELGTPVLKTVMTFAIVSNLRVTPHSLSSIPDTVLRSTAECLQFNA